MVEKPKKKAAWPDGKEALAECPRRRLTSFPIKGLCLSQKKRISSVTIKREKSAVRRDFMKTILYTFESLKKYIKRMRIKTYPR
jgi:hypothetical protein